MNFLFQYNKRYFSELKKRQFPNKDESIFDYLIRREQLFYEKLYLPFNLKLTGNPEKPALILNDTYNVSGYLNGFTLLIFDSPDKDANILLKYNLDNRQLPKSVFQKYVSEGIHKAVYKIRHESGLYLSGRNFIDKLNNRGSYPVYSEHNPLLFLNPISVANELTRYDDSVNVDSIIPKTKIEKHHIELLDIVKRDEIFMCNDILLAPRYNDSVTSIPDDEIIFDYKINSDHDITLFGDINEYSCRVVDNSYDYRTKIIF